MKKSIPFFAIAMAFVLLSSFIPKPKLTKDPVYYVCNARELQQPGINELKYTVSNVTYVDCKIYSDAMVNNQLKEYYTAYYKKSRGNQHLVDVFVYSYDTRDKAEKKRREMIAAYNRRNDVDLLLMEKFSVLCDD